jgi:hypothetical protein
MDWNWDESPLYDSERIRLDARLSPLVVYRFKLPRQVANHEVQLLIDLANLHLDRELPYVAVVLLERGTGIISARQRRMFADWLDERRQDLRRENYSTVIVVPEAIFRAGLRVVYRFQSPPIRTLTVADFPSAAHAARRELERMGEPVTAQMDALLRGL